MPQTIVTHSEIAIANTLSAINIIYCRVGAMKQIRNRIARRKQQNLFVCSRFYFDSLLYLFWFVLLLLLLLFCMFSFLFPCHLFYSPIQCISYLAELLQFDLKGTQCIGYLEEIFQLIEIECTSTMTTKTHKNQKRCSIEPTVLQMRIVDVIWNGSLNGNSQYKKQKNRQPQRQQQQPTNNQSCAIH